MRKRKVLCGNFAVVTASFIVMASSCTTVGRDHGFEVKPFVTGGTARSMAEAAMLGIAGERRADRGDIMMQTVYRLARRSIVKVTVKGAAGSGIIWKADDGIVIVSNRHLLMRDVSAEVFFGDGEGIIADVAGYSQQYDIGFLRIPEANVPAGVMRDIYEVVPVLYEAGADGARDAFTSEYCGKSVLQLGAVIDSDFANFSTGTIRALNFVPLFNTFVLETDCYSKAGMSGGGVFDGAGRLLGMISGGNVPEDVSVRETELTYSIPPILIEKEYSELGLGREDPVDVD